MLREVRTENGIVRGLPAADPRITSFKGIPFAAPPVGKNRWRAPQPAENWEGVREAYTFAPISVQDQPGVGTDIYCKEWHVDPEIAMGEDCLYLNVWTPAKRTDEKLPVLVWYFGGGYQWGYTAEMEVDGERLARRGIIVVSVNYRLGALGFFSHPEITAESPDAPANFGHLDQQAGLRWVIRNIEAFGGDPKNITIAGQSAGGGSVLSQLTCPDNFGSFQKAIVMSAMIRSPYEGGGIAVNKTLEMAEKEGEEFFALLGVKTLEEARALDAFVIRDKAAQFRATHGLFMTTIDGHFCQGDPMKLFAQGKRANVPVMSGNTTDEFTSAIVAADEAELERKAGEIFGDRKAQFLSFPEAKVKAPDGRYAPVSGLECTIKALTLENDALGGLEPVYYYRFDVDIPGEDHPGTFHSVDLWFFFETLAKCWRPFIGRHYDIARKMCNYWANFIRSGNPEGLDIDGTPLESWRPYTAAEPFEMTFTAHGPVGAVAEPSGFEKFIVEKLHRDIIG